MTVGLSRACRSLASAFSPHWCRDEPSHRPRAGASMVAALAASPARTSVRRHCGTASSRRYERHRREKMPFYKVAAEHLEGWGENRAFAERLFSAQVVGELRSYLSYGILCVGFGRARYALCGQGFVVAFSCKVRGVCLSCNSRRMAQTAALLVDRVIPPVPVRQWVISVLKRLRGFLADRPQAVAALASVFPGKIERLLGHARAPSPFCTASARHSTATCICMRARPTASSCRPVTGRRRSCRLGRSPRPIWPRSPRGCAAASCSGSACSGSPSGVVQTAASPAGTASFHQQAGAALWRHRAKAGEVHVGPYQVIAWGSVSRSSSVSAAVASDFGGQKAIANATAAASAMNVGTRNSFL